MSNRALPSYDLDFLEEAAQDAIKGNAHGVFGTIPTCSGEALLALVEVARSARAFRETITHVGGGGLVPTRLDALDAALSLFGGHRITPA